MTAIPHEPSRAVEEKPRSAPQFLVREMWTSLAISVIWLSVACAAIFGPDIVSNNGVGDVGERTTIPSAVVLALFAFLATWVVARYGFGSSRKAD
jgi:hypothetical protein